MPESLPPADAARLYETYGFFLLRRCRTILRDAAAADDALQQAFERILRSGGAVLHADEPLRWLYRVVDHCCFDVLRSRRRAIGSVHGEEVDETGHPGVDIEAAPLGALMPAKKGLPSGPDAIEGSSALPTPAPGMVLDDEDNPDVDIREDAGATILEFGA